MGDKTGEEESEDAPIGTPLCTHTLLEKKE